MTRLIRHNQFKLPQRIYSLWEKYSWDRTRRDKLYKFRPRIRPILYRLFPEMKNRRQDYSEEYGLMSTSCPFCGKIKGPVGPFFYQHYYSGDKEQSLWFCIACNKHGDGIFAAQLVHLKPIAATVNWIKWGIFINHYDLTLEEVLSIPLERLVEYTRTGPLLASHGYHTIKDILEGRKEDIIKIRNFPEMRYNHLLAKINHLGLYYGHQLVESSLLQKLKI